MSFNAKNLNVLGYCNGFTMWHYLSDDSSDVIMGKDYFGECNNIINKGDKFIINAVDKNFEAWCIGKNAGVIDIE